MHTQTVHHELEFLRQEVQRKQRTRVAPTPDTSLSMRRLVVASHALYPTRLELNFALSIFLELVIASSLNAQASLPRPRLSGIFSSMGRIHLMPACSLFASGTEEEQPRLVGCSLSNIVVITGMKYRRRPAGSEAATINSTTTTRKFSEHDMQSICNPHPQQEKVLPLCMLRVGRAPTPRRMTRKISSDAHYCSKKISSRVDLELEPLPYLPSHTSHGAPTNRSLAPINDKLTHPITYSIAPSNLCVV